ncbi:MAG: hypothetical protein CVV00_13565 [Firmicutes bacterium HGW-Firmicutes-5]|jgi:hypothetical protein|nr:MAG: hypothetical protein CVV00_13565 [Firmicutes bacterium HGW-Firmicutes-5]
MNKVTDVLRSHSEVDYFIREKYTDGVERFDIYDNFIEEMWCVTENLSDDITAQIFDFIEESIEPIVFDTDIVFAESEAVLEANDYNIETEEEFVKMASSFYSVIWGLEEKIDNFFMQIIKQEVENSNLSWEPSNLFQKEEI